MSDPTAVREGLPPCVSAAVFEGRRAFMRDIRGCSHGWNTFDEKEGRIIVIADTFIDFGPEPDDWHPGYSSPSGCGDDVIRIQTDDPDEAQAAFKRGAEWVRTGEGP